MNFGRASVARPATSLVTIGTLLLLGGCDFEIVNPGPLQDGNLDLRAAHPAMVKGAGRQYAEGLTWVNFLGGAVAREMYPSGSTAQLGVTLRGQAGELPAEEINIEWGESHRARWLAETFLGRFEDTVGSLDRYAPAAELTLWAGYASRLLGENMCVTILDNGPAEPYRVHLERAEAHFTRAMSIASATNQPQIALAARAGRASVRAYLGRWADAVADASGIPAGFVFSVPYDRTTGPINRIADSQANAPHRSLTVWNTPFDDYYTETGDPRSAWRYDPDPRYRYGSGARDPHGLVVFKMQTKFCSRGACRGNTPINASSHEEMQLIRAEAELEAGNWPTAMAIVNGIRAKYISDTTGMPLEPWVATNLTEAWTALKRERGIVLWLEGRRLGDLRRWAENSTPGELHPLEVVPGRDLCFSPSQQELERNPNL